jgi:outer membrane receptor protein involved in Fe transport
VGNTRAEIALARTDVFIAGFEYNQERFENSFVTDASNNPFVLPRTSLAYFAENRWSPGNRWSVTTGIRVDDIRTYSLPIVPDNSVVKVNPRAAVAYLLRRSGTQATWGATRLHTSAGTGIRPPDGFELGFTNNPHLKPELSITTDVGIEQRLLRDRVVVDVTYFYSRFKDQIVSVGGAAVSSFSSDNLNNSRAQGVELSGRFQATRNLEISAQYTRLNSAILALDGTILAQTPFQVGQPLLRRPADSGSYDVTWQRGRLRLNTNGYARGWVLDDEPNLGLGACSPGVPCLFRNHGYVLANAGFSVRTVRNVEVFGQINNLLNQKYEEVLGFPAYHLNFMSGIRFTFPSEGGGSRRP